MNEEECHMPPVPLSAVPDAAVGLSIVVPVYRGAATVGRLVEVLSALKPEGGLEVILVNDGSPDESDRVCREALRTATVPVTYVEHARNFGEHNAVMTGLRHARGAYVITMDDDLQNPPEEVVRLYDHARTGGWDVVYTRYATKQHAAWRNIGSRFANKVADWLLDKPRGMYLSSFRCMSSLVVRSVTRYRGPYPYIDGLIMQVTQRIDSIEVAHLPRAEGRSNYNLRRLVRLWLNLATSFSLAPLRLAIFVGAAMATLGMGGAAVGGLGAVEAGDGKVGGLVELGGNGGGLLFGGEAVLGGEEGTAVAAGLEGAALTVASVTSTPRTERPRAPFITSSLQIEASSGWPSRGRITTAPSPSQARPVRVPPNYLPGKSTQDFLFADLRLLKALPTDSLPPP